MNEYIKKFSTHDDYEDYISSQDKILPNVSYCVNENELHYNPYTDPRLIVKYMVEDDSEQTRLYEYYAEEGDEESWVRGIDLFDKIEIDGVEVSISDIDSDEGYYQLSEGEHTIKYTLKDPTTIGNYVFDYCLTITSVTIPNSVITIGQNAFSASGLTSITIPNSVITIGEAAFGGSGLTSIIIPNSVTTIDIEAFANCTGLTSINIPNSVTTIRDWVFGGCSGLTNIVIPDGVTSIGEGAFHECTGLISVTIPDSVTSIGQEAFNGCSGLTSVTIEATTPPTLGNNAFDSTNNCPIYVPSASVEAYKAANNWSSLASRIQAIP